MKSNKLFYFSLAVIFIILIFYISPFGNAFKGKSTNTEQINTTTKIILTPQDLNLDLLGINIKDINLSALKGKVIFINVWGTWCPPCRQEMPTIQLLHNKFKNKVSFVMLAIPARGEDVKSSVLDFLEENKYNFPSYEANGMLSNKFQSSVVPFTIIINKKGEIVYKFEGSRDWNDEEANQLISKLIKE